MTSPAAIAARERSAPVTSLTLDRSATVVLVIEVQAMSQGNRSPARASTALITLRASL